MVIHSFICLFDFDKIKSRGKCPEEVKIFIYLLFVCLFVFKCLFILRGRARVGARKGQRERE